MKASGTTQPGLNPYVTDAIIALVLSVALIVEAANNHSSGPIGAGALALLCLSVPLFWRRHAPLPVFGVVFLAALLTVTYAPYSGITCIMVAAYSVGAYSRYRLAGLGALVVSALVIDAVFHSGLPPIPDAASPFVVLIPLWLVGSAIRTRQLRADASEERAAALEREGALITRAALAEERARIARELHDVVAHNVSVMVVQAGAARQVLTSSPDEARAALLAVESTGRDAMSELRGLLGVLGDDGAMALAPQPGMDAIDGLVQRVRDAGLPVALRVEGERRPLPVGIDLAAYRIVQEALTNALKYSSLAPTTVLLQYREHELKVEVLDEGATAPQTGSDAGRGLAGMRERVALFGGMLEAGPRPGQGYAVRAWLPASLP